MYLPPHYQLKDQAKQLAFMEAYPFATLISQQDNRPVATHLPFTVDEREGQVLLHSHLARANLQWTQMMGQEVLVIFQEPHAYISPSLYNKTLNVPTWNYVAVHVYGNVQLIEDPATVFPLLEKMIQAYEPAYQQQWAQLPQHYKEAMARGIVAFEVRATQVQGKEKLSQNKSLEERQRIAEHLKQSAESPAVAISQFMESTF